MWSNYIKYKYMFTLILKKLARKEFKDLCLQQRVGNSPYPSRQRSMPSGGYYYEYYTYTLSFY